MIFFKDIILITTTTTTSTTTTTNNNNNNILHLSSKMTHINSYGTWIYTRTT